VREHHITRRVASRLADPFEDDQQRRHLPAPGQRQQRHCRHLDDVAGDRDRPELAGAVAEPARDQAQAVAEQFAEAGDRRHRRRAGAKHGEIGANDAARSFVGEVGEKAHDADQQDKPQRGCFGDASSPWFQFG
jgi:hypothetical protein